jgi:hypothetical protein
MNELAETWLPPHLPPATEVVGYLLVINLPEGPAVRLSDYSGNASALRQWLRHWLVHRAQGLATRQSPELDDEASFCCVAARLAAAEEPGFALSVFTYGVFPSAPADWRATSLAALVQIGIASLS